MGFLHMNINLFDKTVSFLSKALDVMNVRHEVIASNIANQDTPNYSAKSVNFAKELETVMNTQKANNISVTNPAHINLNSAGSGNVQGLVEIKNTSGADYDNNNVNVEMEMARMAENTITYNASAQILTGKFKGLLSAIREGR
ncbi:MAG: flagellar basal body rod protein FlgB [Nitrospirae bacterium]|nr:flagellar basal body rod protein FlgB [Nitrospirota bacterium]